MVNSKVSIISPTFNCSKFIIETVKSVQSQSYKNWEMIIVDDCSTDNTKEIVEKLADEDHRIKYYRLERNSGAAVARNKALELATGKWIAFLDSDDLWKRNKLEMQIDFMLKNNYAFTYHEYSEIDEFGNHLNIEISGPKKIGKIKMFSFCWPGCLTVMYDREKIGNIQISDIKKNNDYAIWLKVIKKADCYLLPEKLAFYRIRVGSISHTNILTLIKYHYILFKEGEHFNSIISLFLTFNNLVWGLFKKIRYVNRIRS